MRETLERFWRDDSAATAIEYALIATFIALAIITALTTLGTNLKAPLNKVSTAAS